MTTDFDISPGDDALPFISVIIPVPPGHIPESAKQLETIDYPKDRMEVIVIEGRNPSRQRNEGVEKSQGHIIYFMDDDVHFDPDLLRKAVQLHKQDVGVVGGPAETLPTDGFLKRCFGYVMGSYLCGMTMRARFRGCGTLRDATERELILCNLSFKKAALPKNPFDERLYPNEECELLNRMAEDGIKFLYDPDLKTYRSRRPNLYQFARQWFRYGGYRMLHFILHPKFSRGVFFAPSLFVLYLASLLFLRHPIFLVPVLMYGLIVLAASAIIAVESKEVASILLTPFLFPLVHISYGLGFMYGYVKYGLLGVRGRQGTTS